MKAAVWTDYGKLDIKEIPMPEIGPDEVLLKVIKAGLCITDLHVYKGWFKYGEPPHVLGHEVAARIVKTGENVTKVKEGMRVVVETSIGCGHCEECMNGQRHLCKDMTEIGFSPNNGAYAQYLKAPVENIIEIPDGVSDNAAAILESVICPAGALYRRGVKFGDTVAVFGVGPAGLAFIQAAKAMGAGQVIAIARNERRLKKSLDFGADKIICSATENVAEKLAEYTMGRGPELICEATGAPAVIEETFQLARVGGRIILYGIPSDDARVNLPTSKIIMKQLEVYGAVGNPQVWKPLLNIIAGGRMNLDAMVTHEFALEDIEKAMDFLENKREDPIKIVINPWIQKEE